MTNQGDKDMTLVRKRGTLSNLNTLKGHQRVMMSHLMKRHNLGRERNLKLCKRTNFNILLTSKYRRLLIKLSKKMN